VLRSKLPCSLCKQFKSEFTIHKESVRCLFRVRVNKIESTRDLDGNLGKRIELLEEREVNPYILRPQSDEAKMAQDIMQALQTQMPFLPQKNQMATPKIILFLTEHEYDSLGISFDVNQVYEVVLENQSIRFKKI
jgi:hypothetical protein